MDKQFENSFTFFDLNIEEQEENKLPFATLYFYVKGQNKGRYLRNRAAVEFLKGHEISKEDKKLIDSYFDGSVKENNRKNMNIVKFVLINLRETSCNNIVANINIGKSVFQLIHIILEV